MLCHLYFIPGDRVNPFAFLSQQCGRWHQVVSSSGPAGFGALASGSLLDPVPAALVVHEGESVMDLAGDVLCHRPHPQENEQRGCTGVVRPLVCTVPQACLLRPSGTSLGLLCSSVTQSTVLQKSLEASTDAEVLLCPASYKKNLISRPN